MEGEGLFAVDRWGCKKSKVFFLTHMHADHIKGLSQHWRRGPIYCSAITAALLRLKFPALVDIHVLPLSTPTLIPLPSPYLLEVTAIDADHCPGSLMFVFHGAFGCILHTGDFRWESGSPRLECMKRCLAAAIGGSRVNLVHLDNTFCSPHFSFPTRHSAAQQVVDIIMNHEDADVLIGVDMLGKEELLIFIAKALRTKVWVWPERLQTMRILGISDFFTTDTTATRIRAVPRYSISHVTLTMLNEIKPTVAVLPSGLRYSCKALASRSAMIGTDTTSEPGTVLHLHQTPKTEGISIGKDCKSREVKQQNVGKDIYLVPYSLHSCFSELKDFLDFIKPLSVKGNLRSSKMDINPLLQMLGNTEKDSKYPARFGNTSSAMVAHETDEILRDCHSLRGKAPLLMSSNKCTHANDQYLSIVNCDPAHLEKDTYFIKKLKGRVRLKKVSCKRSQQAWTVLQRRRGGGTHFCTEP